MKSNRRSTESFFDTALQALSCINQSGMKISSENKLGQCKQTFCKGGETAHNCSKILRVS